LYPILREKSAYLHNEGAAAVLWAFSKLDSVEEDVFNLVLDNLSERPVGAAITYKQSFPLSTEKYHERQAYAGEHMVSDTAKNLIFNNHSDGVSIHLSLQQLQHNTELSADTQAKISSLISQIESSSPDLSAETELFLALNSSKSRDVTI